MSNPSISQKNIDPISELQHSCGLRPPKNRNSTLLARLMQRAPGKSLSSTEVSDGSSCSWFHFFCPKLCAWGSIPVVPGSVYPLAITQQVQGMFSKIWKHGAPAMRIGGVAAFALRLALGPWTWPRGLDMDGAKFGGNTKYPDAIASYSKFQVTPS